MLKGCPSLGLWNRPHVGAECDSADFDGSNDVMVKGSALSGVATGKRGLLSAWVRLDGGNGADLMIIGGDNAGDDLFQFYRTSGNLFAIFGGLTGGTDPMLITTVATYTAGATWRHIMASWDLATGDTHLYVNDVSDLNEIAALNSNISYANAVRWTIGGYQSGATLRLNACLAELYFAPGQYLDLSITRNRRRLITAAGKAQNLGPNAIWPTGVAPALYHRLDKGETANNFANNRGTGGAFALTGALATGSTSPSD